MRILFLRLKMISLMAALIGVAVLSLNAQPGMAQSQSQSQSEVTGFMQAVAEAAAGDKALSAYYKEAGYQPVWTGRGGKFRSRRKALLKALNASRDHGLPGYDVNLLKANLRAVKSDRDLGRIEVELSKLFLRYARDIQTGILTPARVDAGIARKVPLRGRKSVLAAFVKSSPAKFMRRLAPSSPEYARLMKEKMKLEKLLASGGWGQLVPAGALKPGATGNAVLILRNRLIAMGYMRRSAVASYDGSIQTAVQTFQRDHGLAVDGVAGKGTLGELNVSVEQRLASVLVAMERERWINMDLGKRYIWVNLADFTTKIIDDGVVTFRTRSVVGKNVPDRRSPEFSDEMEHMVINPTWNVPRSITVKEYLPQLQQDAGAVSFLDMYDRQGRVVSRSEVDFNQYTRADFPFSLKQAPSGRNALGLVKFMLPNRFNIYLHDTPAKSLFGRERRDFSHGCIRLADPFGFAYALLAPQSQDPEGEFQALLRTGREAVVPLKQHVPVHIIYRTAISKPRGGMEYRRDVYGRDAKIFNALQNAGVRIRAINS
jgi:L,D-transpeptidase YcbB